MRFVATLNPRRPDKPYSCPIRLPVWDFKRSAKGSKGPL